MSEGSVVDEPVLETFTLDDAAVFVTGGASGIGRGCAKACLEAGANVAIVDVDEERLAETADTFEDRSDLDGAVLSIEADVSDVDEIEAAVDHTVEEFGGLDVAYANAGISGTSAVGNPITSYPIETWEDVLSVNLRGVFLTNRAAARAMREDDGGSIINTASILGVKGSRMPGLTPYVVSKGGVIQLTRQLSAELGPYGIRVNAIAPGWVQTNLGSGGMSMADGPMADQLRERISLKRFGEPEDLKGLAVFLASDASAYCTGGVFHIDGGLSAI